MIEIREPQAQKVIDTLLRQRQAICKEVEERYQQELNQRTAPIQKMLERLYRDNPVVGVELTPQEQIELLGDGK